MRRLSKAQPSYGRRCSATDYGRGLVWKVRRVSIYSTIDLSKGYWQKLVAKENIHKTAFVTPDGCYEFLRMPFGMKNSGATLIRGMRKLLQDQRWARCFFIVPAVPVLGTLLKIPAVPVLGTEKSKASRYFCRYF